MRQIADFYKSKLLDLIDSFEEVIDSISQNLCMIGDQGEGLEFEIEVKPRGEEIVERKPNFYEGDNIFDVLEKIFDNEKNVRIEQINVKAALRRGGIAIS